MSYAAWSVIAGEQPTTSKWNILGSNDSSFNDGSGIGAGAILPNNIFSGASTNNNWSWDSWTPSFTNLTVGNGTLLGKYLKLGKVVNYMFMLTFGSTTSISGNVDVSLPVNASSDYGTGNYNHVGIGGVLHSGSVSALSHHIDAATKGALFGVNAPGPASYAYMTATVPVTFGTGDVISVQGVYEAA